MSITLRPKANMHFTYPWFAVAAAFINCPRKTQNT